MEIGLTICSFTWPDGRGIGPTLAELATTAEHAGVKSLWVMDHLFQIPPLGSPEQEMLEAYTTLGFIAAHTHDVTLGTLVTGVTYREPGLLAKCVTTLDVLSEGRAWLGIGAAWFEEEHEGLGFEFPPLAHRFEYLEETLQICLQMWSDEDDAFEGKHFSLGRTLNSPPAVQDPHPPILIGGSGEKKTLLLVARYAQACNLYAEGPEVVGRKLDVLRGHCEREGTDYDAIQKTILYPTIVPNAEGADQFVEAMADYAELGVNQVVVTPSMPNPIENLDVLGGEVIPRLEQL